MIPRWLIKTALGLLALFILVFDVGARFVVRVQLDDTATSAVDEAQRVLRRTRSTATAEQAAREVVEAKDATFVSFAVDTDGRIHVTVSKHVKSYVLHRIQPLRDWYDVTVSATSVPAR